MQSVLFLAFAHARGQFGVAGVTINAVRTLEPSPVRALVSNAVHPAQISNPVACTLAPHTPPRAPAVRLSIEALHAIDVTYKPHTLNAIDVSNTPRNTRTRTGPGAKVLVVEITLKVNTECDAG